ncbi:MAG: DnaJ C-terminal domain-containing protein [Vicinamibacterales bacterium]
MDLYAVLGLDDRATLADIKRAYRRLARRYHPDINPGDPAAERRFRQIMLAYETLSDPGRRRRYDLEGVVEGAGRAETVTFGFEGFDFSVDVSGHRASTFGDLFGEVLGRQAQASEGPSRGADLHAAVEVSFEESIRGVQRLLPVTRAEVCPLCSGLGTVSAADSPCVACGGSGTVRSSRGHMVFSKPCDRCDGSGRQREAICRRCQGQGNEVRAETVTADIPPGVSDGARVRIPGKGHAGRRGGPPGDLLLTVTVQPHPFFRREGCDLHIDVPLAIHEAGLGARIEVPTPDGPARLRVPPGTQSGQRFRLRGRGVPTPRGERGDLVVEVRLVLPPVLDERSKELLREFGRINAGSVREPAGGSDEWQSSERAARTT